MNFDARTYWEDRLDEDWSLRGVGFRRLGSHYNNWMYRLRAEVFQRAARVQISEPAVADVLDIGSGTGFYIGQWQSLGARGITGVDLTAAAVGRLRSLFPGVRFHQGDVSAGLPMLPRGGYQAISAMDVLFHIVDDTRYQQALTTVAELLAPGGVFLMTDDFPHHGEVRGPHFAYRTLAEVESRLAAAGLEPVARFPVFVTMNQPLDCRSRVLRAAWSAAFGVISLGEPLGELAGRALYRLDSHLVQSRLESPATEMMICRARSGGSGGNPVAR